MSDLTEETRAWWHRPLWGENSLFEQIINLINLPQVSEIAISLHDQTLKELEKLNSEAMRLDNDKFNDKGFQQFLEIKIGLQRCSDEYQGLNSSIKLLNIILENKEKFLALEKLEKNNQGVVEQQLYQFVVMSLSWEMDQQLFRHELDGKFQLLEKQVQETKVIQSLQLYITTLIDLSESEFGLKLLYLFKKYNFADYSIIKDLADIIYQLKTDNLSQLKNVSNLIKSNQEMFNNLGTIIGIPKNNNQEKSWLIMVKYIVLMKHYRKSYTDFAKLMTILQKWYRSYFLVLGIRQEYSSTKYKRPISFSQKIPGIKLHEKYKIYLHDLG